MMQHCDVAEGEARMTRCPELSIEEIVTDPIVRALMSADRVDPAEFEALLRSKRNLTPRRPSASGHTRGAGNMQGLRLLATMIGCSMLVLACGYAAANCSLHSQVKAAGSAVVNRAAKQDRLDIPQVSLAFRAG